MWVNPPPWTTNRGPRASRSASCRADSCRPESGSGQGARGRGGVGTPFAGHLRTFRLHSQGAQELMIWLDRRSRLALVRPSDGSTQPSLQGSPENGSFGVQRRGPVSFPIAVSSNGLNAQRVAMRASDSRTKNGVSRREAAVWQFRAPESGTHFSRWGILILAMTSCGHLSYIQISQFQRDGLGPQQNCFP